MTKKIGWLILLLSFSTLVFAKAATCPAPHSSSLEWGEIPTPWVINPYSPNHPQAAEDTQFARANILVAGVMGRGVVCNYKNSMGYYSIWWEVNVKVPARTDNNWRDSLGGYECTDSVEECLFYVGS